MIAVACFFVSHSRVSMIAIMHKVCCRMRH
jgi:hypothetical protein